MYTLKCPWALTEGDMNHPPGSFFQILLGPHGLPLHGRALVCLGILKNSALPLGDSTLDGPFFWDGHPQAHHFLVDALFCPGDSSLPSRKLGSYHSALLHAGEPWAGNLGPIHHVQWQGAHANES